MPFITLSHINDAPISPLMDTLRLYCAAPRVHLYTLFSIFCNSLMLSSVKFIICVPYRSYGRAIHFHCVYYLHVYYLRHISCVIWRYYKSEYFNVSNRVKQGGVISLIFFSLYIDPLLLTYRELAGI